MCDACEHRSTHPLGHHTTGDDDRVDRRSLLRRAGIGGVAAAIGSLWLPEVLAEAAAPPFESLHLGEDRLPKLTAAAVVPAAPVPAAPVPAALVPAARRPAPSHLLPPNIVTRAAWGADESLRTWARGFAPVRKLIVHHTASGNNPRNPAQVMRDMYRYHVRDRGFSDLGYNFAIDHKGVVYEGRWARTYGSTELHDGEDANGYGVVGAHALGVNAGSCGIVLIGDFTRRSPTNAALASLIQLLAWKAAVHQIDALRKDEYISIYGVHRTFANVAGHRNTGNTVCPGGYLYDQLGWIRDQVVMRAGIHPAKTIDMSRAIRWTAETPTRASSPAAASGGGSTLSPANPTGAKLTGYRLLTSDGRVITLGSAAKLGSPRDHGIGAVRAISGVPGRNGFLAADTSGRVVGFGGAASGAPGSAIQAADMAGTPSGRGYWVLTPRGGVYAYGTARHHGSLARSGIGTTGVKIRSTPTGFGYWILGGNGRIYAFGDAVALASPGAGTVDLWPTPSGRGYWALLADGRVGAYGDAGYFGAVPDLRLRWRKPAVALIGMPSGRGYAIAASDGGMFNFGSSPFLGSLGGSGRKIVGMALAFG